MAFRFEKNKWFYTYINEDENGTRKDLWEQLVESKDPILKRYVIFYHGWHQYAEGITGCRHSGALYILDGEGTQGWASRPEAYQWMKEHGWRNRHHKSSDVYYGVGGYADNYRIMRLDKYIKMVTGGKDWYLNQTCSEPNYASLV